MRGFGHKKRTVHKELPVYVYLYQKRYFEVSSRRIRTLNKKQALLKNELKFFTAKQKNQAFI